jgi:hypothetical protein
MHRVFRRGWDAPSKNPVQTRGAQDQRGMGRPFFWMLFFGRPKKSIAVAGPRTGVKLGFAVAKQIIGSSTDALHFRSAHPMALNPKKIS